MILPTASPNDQPTLPLYVEVWRTDAGNRRPLGRYEFALYDPVREAS